PPKTDLEKESETLLALRALIHSGSVKSAHDCSEGGLAVALAEGCISQQIARETPRLIGAQIDLNPPQSTEASPQKPPQVAAPGLPGRLDSLLFGEAQGRIIVSVAAVNAVKVLAQAKLLGVAAVQIGTVGGN